MRQVHSLRQTGGGIVFATKYLIFGNPSGTWSNPLTPPQGVEAVMPGAGSVKNVVWQTDVAQGFDITITLQKNGVDTALVVTIPGSSTMGSDLTHEITFVEGDHFNWKWETSDLHFAPNMTYWYELATDAADASYYSGPPGGLGGVTNIGGAGVFGNGAWDSSPSMGNTNFLSINSTLGNLTKYLVHLDTAPGMGTSYIFRIWKNGVEQNGTGGTVDTTGTIADTSTDVTVTFTLPCVGSDVVEIQWTKSGSPAATTCAMGFRFEATTAGQWNWTGGSNVVVSDTALDYLWSQMSAIGTPDGTEAESASLIGPDGLYLQNYYHRLSSAPDVAPSNKGYQYNLRKNATNTALTLSITGDSVTGQDLTDVLQLVENDTVDILSTPLNGVAAKRHYWAFTASTTAPTPPVPPQPPSQTITPSEEKQWVLYSFHLKPRGEQTA